MNNKKEFKLCYVNKCWAYFTTNSLKDQWGDDWNDAPYEYNAGEPYEWAEYRKVPEYEIMKVAFDGDLLPPGDGFTNSPYSVDTINKGVVPWLRTWDGDIRIFAGVTLEEFKRLIKDAGGDLYIKEE